MYRPEKKLTIFSDGPATDLQNVGLWFVFIFSLLFISGFTGLLPVFSCVMTLKSLIINTIHFCRFACICWVVVGVFSARY